MLRWMIASEDAKNPLQLREQKGMQGYGLLYPPGRRGLQSGVRGVCGDASATSAGSDFELNHVYIDRIVPPLERLERRDVTE